MNLRLGGKTQSPMACKCDFGDKSIKGLLRSQS